MSTTLSSRDTHVRGRIVLDYVEEWPSAVHRCGFAGGVCWHVSAICSCGTVLEARSQDSEHSAADNLRDEFYWHRSDGRAAFEVVAEILV